MPSSLPTREEVEAEVAFLWVEIYQRSSNHPEVMADYAHALSAACALLAHLPEGQAEAPKGETETGEERLFGMVRAWASEARRGADGRLDVAEAVGYKGALDDLGDLLDDYVRASPASVPVSTERPDGGLTHGKNDRWTTASGYEVRVSQADRPERGGIWMSVDGSLFGLGREDRLRLIAALGAPAPASLPPLTDDDVERAAEAAWNESETARLQGWANAGSGSRDLYLVEARAALLSTGRYATPREKG